MPYLLSGDIRSIVKVAAGRYLRLAIPIFAACALVHLFIVAGVVDAPAERYRPFQELAVFEPSLSHLLGFSLFDVFFRYTTGGSYIGPLWTMSVELFGSFVVLGALAVTQRLPWRFFGLAALSVVLAAHESLIVFFTIGAIAAECHVKGWFDRIAPPLGLALIALGVAIPFRQMQSIPVAMVGVTALVVGCITIPAVRIWLSSPLSRWLGTISFPLYLVHGPIMMIFGAPFYQADSVPRLAVQFAIVFLAFVVAVVFTPVNEFAVRISRWVGEAVTSALFRQASSRVPAE